MIRACTACTRKNRVPAKKLHERGKCGACKALLPPLDAPIEIETAGDFDALLAEAAVPILIDFWAPWCGPCRLAAPEVAKAAQELAGRGLVVKVDTDRLPELAARYGVRGIPQFTVVHGGKVASSDAGLVGARELVARVLRAAHRAA